MCNSTDINNIDADPAKKSDHSLVLEYMTLGIRYSVHIALYVSWRFVEGYVGDEQEVRKMNIVWM